MGGVADALRSRRAGLTFLSFLAALAFALQCGPASDAGSSSDPSPSTGGNSTGDWVGRTVPSSDAQAMTVTVDADKTLTAQPGQGVGVFVEYRSGGHWRLAWSCDTTLTGQPCDYQVAIAAKSGAIGNVAALASANSATQPSPQEVDVRTLTSTTLDGVTLDAPPGSSLMLDVLLAGAKDGVTLFFVEGGVVNGGYTGALTDPLVFEPSSP